MRLTLSQPSFLSEHRTQARGGRGRDVIPPGRCMSNLTVAGTKRLSR